MEIKLLFNYRSEGGKEISLKNNKTVNVKVFRRGPRGLVAVVEDGIKILWNNDEADSHLNDSEQELVDRLKEILEN